MGPMEDKKNLLAKILYEAKSYNNFEDIEKLVEKGMDLANIPLQPLYVSLLSAPSSQVANVLSKLSGEQRQALLDLDLWNRDRVDVYSFEFWLETYSKCREDDIVKEFVESDDFLLYLKSRVNIHTFDAEDPEYPDHDNYFLTDDSLLLIEYGDEYAFANELKYFIRHLYDSLGVENAYTTLFKLINDSFSYLQESEFNHKRERLREFGFVDYYEAKEALHPFLSLKGLDRFIEGKAKVTASVDAKAQNQSLHSSALVPFDKNMENILFELSKVESEERKRYLHFNFVRLVNSTITLNDALKAGRVELSQIGKGTKAALDLGLQYAKTKRSYGESESLFDYFDFGEVYKIGSTLWHVNQVKIKKALKAMGMSEDEKESFLGDWWNSFVDASLGGDSKNVPSVKNFGVKRHPQLVDSVETWTFWREQALALSSLAPFIASFHQTFKSLCDEGKLRDEFFINYEVEAIDFEALILSSFINFALGNFEDAQNNRMGLSIDELKSFLTKWSLVDKGEYRLRPVEDQELWKLLGDFKDAFGMNEVQGLELFLYGILYEHLSGYEYDTLADEDYAHVGGPLILNTVSKA